MTQTPRITGASIVAVYVDDYDAGLAFYSDMLGLEKSFDMGPQGCFFRLGPEGSGLYLEGGNKPNAVDNKTVRSSFILDVEGARDLFVKLRDAGVKTVQESPMPMQEDQYWFQFFDPAGNLIEVLGS